jgi:hypothetical protein
LEKQKTKCAQKMIKPNKLQVANHSASTRTTGRSVIDRVLRCFVLDNQTAVSVAWVGQRVQIECTCNDIEITTQIKRLQATRKQTNHCPLFQ